MLIVAREPGITTLTLDRPELGNALGPALVEALIGEITQATQDDTVHALVLRAAGKHFCTGLDLSGLDALSDGDLVLRLVRIETLLSLLWHAPISTAVLAQGRTWGAGADLFAACEQRVAAPGTSFRFPGAQFGIVLGTRRLADRIGVDAARRLVLEAGELDTAQALAAGLASAMGNTLSQVEPLVPGRTAAAIRAASRPDTRDADMAALVRSAATPGLRERIARYRERLRRR